MSFAVPNALNALVTLTKGLGFTGVQVFDGPPNDEVGAEVVAIGLMVEEVGIEGRNRQAGLRTRQETFDIGCLVAVGTGDDEIAPVRQRTYEIFTAISQALDADRTLNGAVQLASLTSSTFVPDRSESGVVAHIEFTVQVTVL